MIRFYKIFGFASLILMLSTNTSYASHVAGADVTYQCLGNDSFLVQLNVFWDCNSFATMGVTETIDISSSCGANTNLVVNLINPGGTEISQLCSADSLNSSCNGGNLPGMMVFTYEAIVVVPPCADYIFAWDLCCRNNSLTFGTSNPTFYVEAEMNSINSPCNSSPFFTAQPIPYVCANQQVVYNFGVSETDGDSVYYQFISAQDGAGSNIAYTNPYTPQQPIPSGITLDSITGLLVFTPAVLGNVVIVVEVQEFDDQGNYLGSVIRDIQFVVQTCNNTVPYDTTGVITNLTGTATQISDYSIILCDGESFSFDVQMSDPDGDSLTLTSNVTQVLPGATFTTTPGDPAVATISWTATGGNNFNNAFAIFADDDVCPIPGQQTYVYNVQIQESTVASEDAIVVCGQQQAVLSVQGGNLFNWYALPGGDTINPNVNFGCDTCAVTWALPDSTTKYEVVSDLTTMGCKNRDTVTVFVVPDFDYTMWQSDTTVCLLGEVDFVVTPDTSDNFTFSWTPTAFFPPNSTDSNVTATVIVADTTNILFTVSATWGCVKQDTFKVIASQSIQPILTIPADTTICVGDTVQLWAVNTNAIPTQCDTYIVESVPIALIAGSGTAVSLGDDQMSGDLPIGFDFNFFCDTFNTFRISSNGFLTFDNSTNSGCCSGQVLPNNLDPNNLIAFAWEDLDPANPGGGVVEYFTTGTAPDRILIMNFTGVPHWPGPSPNNNVTVQVQLYEGSNDIEIHTTSQPDAGGTHTMGIENQGGTIGFAVPGRNGQSWTATNDAWRFKKPIGNSSFVFNWTFSPSVGPWISATDTDAVFIYIEDTTIFTVVISDTIGGCSDTARINVYSVDSFSVVRYVSDTAICLYDEFTMGVTPPSDTIYGYTWTPPTFLSSATDSFVVADTVSTPGLLTYTVEIANPLGCERYETFSVMVSQGAQPIISIVGDSTICEGDSSLLSTVFNPSSTLTCNYCLKMYDGFGDGWNDAYLQMWLDDTLAYDSLFTQTPWGNGDSAIFCLDIAEGTKVDFVFFSGIFDTEIHYEWVDQFGTIIFEDGDIPTFTAPLAGQVYSGLTNCGTLAGPSLTYQWSPTATLSPANGSTTNVFPLVDETYQVIVFDSIGGCSDTATYSVYVVPNFVPTAIATDTAICKNGGTTFNISVNPAPVGAYAYDWAYSPYLASLNGATNSVNNVGLCGDVNFNFTVSSPDGCEKEGVATVYVSTGIQPNIVVNDETLCEGSSVVLAPGLVGINTVADTCSLVIYLHDSFGDGWNGAFIELIAGDDTTIIGQSWQFPTMLNGTDTVVVVPVGMCDSIQINYTNGFFPNEESYYIYNAQGDPLFQGGDSLLGTVPAQGNVWSIVNACGNTSASYLYEWSPGGTLSGTGSLNVTADPTITTTYELIATDSVGFCADTAQVTVNVVPIPDPQVTDPGDFCADDTNVVDLSALVSIAGGTWTGPGVINTTLGTFDPVVANVGNNNVNYSVTVSGCTGDTTISITIFGIPTAPSVTGSGDYCQGTIMGNQVGVGGGGVLYWYANDLNTVLDSGLNPNLGLALQTDTMFVNEIENGCEGPFTSVAVMVNPSPIVSFSATPNAGVIPLNVLITNSSDDNLSYNWTFGNNTNSQEQYPETVVYADSGVFTIILVGTDSLGCTNSDTLYIDADDVVYVPKVFTPNGDGFNDVFRVTGFPTANFECLIYNRWGVKVFEFEQGNPSDFWDGERHPDGTYFVVINYTNYSGEAAQYSGTLTLISKK